MGYNTPLTLVEYPVWVYASGKDPLMLMPDICDPTLSISDEDPDCRRFLSIVNSKLQIFSRNSLIILIFVSLSLTSQPLILDSHTVVDLLDIGNRF